MLHIFKKDVRRLWWGIALAMGLQAALAIIDIRRDTAFASTEENSLMVLLLVTWAGLIVKATHEEPLVGDRQFWISRPYRRHVLLGSKLLFALVCVHAPAFLADVTILATHGFQPWRWLPQLLGKQVALAAALTLPAVALAAILQDFAHLALTVIAVSGLSTFLFGAVVTPFRGTEDQTLENILVTLVALAAAAVILIQFRRRNTLQSRGLGIAAVVVLELALACLPPVALARTHAVFDPTHFQVHLAPGSGPFPPGNFARDNGSGWTKLWFPVDVTGIPNGQLASFQLRAFELVSGGRSLPQQDVIATHFGPVPQRGPIRPPILRDWLMLQMRPSTLSRIQDQPVDVKVTAAVVFSRLGEPSPMPLGGSAEIAGVGRCAGHVIETVSGYMGPADSVRVVCESPSSFVREPLMALDRNNYGPAVFTVEHGMSLSPLHRGQVTFYRLPEASTRSQTVWIQPVLAEGRQIVTLELHHVRLSDYLVH